MWRELVALVQTKLSEEIADVRWHKWQVSGAVGADCGAVRVLEGESALKCFSRLVQIDR